MSHSIGTIATIEKSLRFISPNFKTRSRASRFALLPLALAVSLSSQTNAGPEGGEVINGAGSINRDGNTTTIHQETDRMTIDWQSYDVNTNERVNYIQPDSSSLSLNRILSDRGSQILGRIDANGHVILMNPNGIIFGKDAVVNAGGLLASGLSIDPADFLNGDFTFSALENTEGSVINRGLLNASTGGSISLLGKRVENEGLISADLGQINLAAGEGAVVTFDNEGLLGLRVTEAILQDDLGVDPAVVNSGEVSAENGQILITASVSEDIFSEAVNNGPLNLESSVVVHDDGTFTLGEGADVVNTGSISASGENGAGEIVVLGENITSSGDVSANTNGDSNNSAGSIEIHSNDTTLLTEQSTTIAIAENSGQGGDVKVLGSNVGLFDEAVVDASGANGGGQVLIGGDVTGANEQVRNAEFIYLGENTEVNANALDQGNGGKLITFASDTARIYGQLNSIGGVNGGDGGFVETSGLLGFEILNAPNIYAYDGLAGEWLIDPVNISIVNTTATEIGRGGSSPDYSFVSVAVDVMGLIVQNEIRASVLLAAFEQNGTVTIRTGDAISAPSYDGAGNITFETDLNYSSCGGCVTGSGTPTLILDTGDPNANGGGIVDFNGFDITNGGNSNRSLNIEIGSSTDRVSSVTNSSGTTSNIVLNGGDFTSYSSGSFSGENIDINTSGGDVTIDSSGSSISLLNANTGAGRLDLDAPGAITSTGRFTSDDLRLVSTTSDILLNEVRSSWAFLRSERDLVIQDGDDLRLWVADAERDLNLTASQITMLGAEIISGGDASLTATGSGGISLGLGAVFLNNVSVNSVGDVDISDQDGGLNLDQVSVVGNLDLRSVNGDIVDLPGANISVGGVATFTAGTSNTDYFNVYLDSTDNDFNGVAITDGDNATFYDINSIELLDINLGAVGPQELIVNTRGDIVGAGEVFAQRATFDTNGLGGVSLTNPNNYLDLLRVGSSANPVSSLEYSDLAGVSLWNGVYVSGDVNLNTGTSIPTRVSTNAGDVVVGGNFTVSSNGADIDLRSSDNVTIGGAASFINSGNVELQETDSVVLGASSVSGDLIVESGGNVGQVGVVSVGNITDISAPGSNVTLDNASNDFEFITLLANNAIITDQDNVNLYGVNVDAFTLNTGGDVLDVDSTSTIVSGVAIIDVGSTNDIYLNAPGTDFNDLSILSANNATVIDANSIDLGGLSVGVLSVTASEEITDSASITAETAYFNAGGDAFDITLNNSSNDFNFISVNGAYRAEVRDVDSVSLFDTAVTILDVYSNGPITDAGPLLISGAARFNPGLGNFVRVDDTGNDFNFVRIGTSSNSASTASIRDINEITLARTYVQGSFTVFSNGHITDSASQVVGESINIGGLAYFSAGSANDVILDYGHDFSTVRFASVRDAELVSDGSVAIGVSTIGRDLNVSFVRDDSFSVLLDAGSIDVAGVTTVNARSVILDDDHDFNTVEINTSTGSVTLNDVDNVVFGDSSIGSTLNVTTNGSITDTGVLTVVGNSNFSAGSANNITLDSASNDFGQVSVGSANTVSLVDSNALVLGDITVSGDLDLTVGGGLTDSSAVIIGGGLTLDSAGGGINLSSAYHQVAGSINVTQSGAPAPFELWVQNADLGTVVTNSNSVATINIQGDFTSGAASIISNGVGEFEIVGDASANIFTFNSGFSFTGSRLYVDGADSADTFNLNASAPFVLAGGEGDDQFNLANGITFDLIDGNGGLSDTLDYSTWTSDVVVDLESVNVDVITGSLSNSNNTLMGSDVDSAFNITAQNDGDVGGVIAFADFNNITGGTGADTFTFGPTGEITGILDGGAGAGSNTIEARDGVDNTFIVSGENSGSLQETAGATYVPGFQNVQNLTGGDQNDTFSIQDNASVDGTINGNGGANSLSYALQSGQVIVDLAGGVSGALDIQNIIGNGSDSRLIGDDNNNTWVIDGADEGSVDGINFEAFNNVQGGDGDNTFTIQSGGSISGEIRGGSAGGADSLNALPGDNSWNITGTNVGDLQVSGGATYVANFAEIETLSGQTGVDTFSFAGGASFAGTINGGTGVAEDELNFSLQSSVDVDLTSLNVSNIEAVRGNGTDSSISGDAAGNTWVISGTDQGSVNSGTGFNFYDFNNITGGTGDDVFDFSSGGSLTGTLDGGLAGSDEIIGRTEGVNWNLSSANGGSADLSAGGAFINAFADVEELSGQAGTDTLEAFDQTNAWALNDPNSGTINGSELVFSGMENLVGGSGDDTFDFNFDGQFAGTINAGGEVLGDSINIIDVVSITEVVLGASGINGVVGIESVTDAGGTLVGLDAGTNVWTVSGANSGSVSNGAESLDFVGFSTMRGSNTAADQLTIEAAASLAGSFIGGDDTAQNTITNNNDGNAWTLGAANDGEVNGTTTFSGVGTISGSGTDTLEAFDQTNVWALNDPNSGTINATELVFSGMENLTGGSGDDTFDFDFDGQFAGTIDAGGEVLGDSINIIDVVSITEVVLGASGINGVVGIESVTDAGGTLVGLDAGTNVWTVSGANSGSVSNGAENLDFVGFSTLQGSDSVADVLVIDDGASFAGDFNGGTDTAQNSFTHNDSAANTWVLTAANDGDVDTTSFTNVSTINGSGNDTLEAFDQANAWDLSGSTSGTINVTELTFTGMENLIGGSNDDSFTFNFSGAYSGLISGGSEVSGDRIDVSSVGVISYALGDEIVAGTSIQGVEEIAAATGSSLQGGTSGTNDWTIDTANGGEITNGADTIGFQGFTSLVGSATTTDNFTIQSGASFGGSIDGGADASLLSNTLTNENVGETWVLTGANSGEVGTPVTAFSNIGRVVASSGDGDSLRGVDQANTWQITGENIGSVQETTSSEILNFEGFENLIGGTDVDNFDYFVGGSISGFLDGNSGGVQDRLNLINIDTPVNVQIGGAANTYINVANIERIDRPVAGSEASFIFHALATSETDSYTWTINAENSGSVGPTAGPNIDNVVEFTNFGNVVGGIGEDLVNYVNDGTLISFNGGGGSGSLILNYYESSSPFDIVIGETYLNVDAITINPIGVAVEDVEATLRISDADTTANDWTIDDVNSGSVDTDGDAEADFVFINFNHLFGGSGDDAFNFDGAGNITGQINGEGGTNIVDGGASTSDLAFQFNGDATARDDSSITSLTNIFDVSANGANDNTIIGANQTNGWNINLVGGGTISGGFVFTGFDNLVGNAGDDSFVLDGGTVVSVDGQGGSDSLVADSRANTFDVAGLNSGVLNSADANGGTSFSNVESLTGNNAADSFVIGASGQLDGTIDGSTGTDTITGNDSFNSWTIETDNSGSLTGIDGFEEIENLVGGAGDDTFNFIDDSVVSSITLNAGNNIVNITSRTSAVNVDLNTGAVGGVNVTDVANISGVNANDAYSNTLVSVVQDNTWTISEINGGDVSGIDFSGFHNLQGSTGVDSFVFAGGYVEGDIDGGAGAAQDTITADDATNSWLITADNSGTLNTETNFSDVEVLNGGSGTDNFVIGDGFSVDQINGGLGSNTIDLTAWSSDISADLEQSTVASIQFTLIGRIDANASNNNTFQGGVGNQAWVLTPTDSSVGGFTFSGFQNIVGSPLTDDVTLQGGTFAGNFDGLGGSDILRGNNESNDWEITGIESGNLNSNQFNFTGIANLVGNNQDDTFTLNGGSISGSIDGGAGIDDINALTGNNTWNITSANSGNATNVNAFSAVERLVGGDALDRFVVSDGATIDAIDGGAGDSDVLDITALTFDVVADIEAGVVAGLPFTQIEVIDANGTQDNAIIAPTGDNAWDISALNAGTLNSALQFAGFQNLMGNTGADDFVLNGVISGDVDGAGGVNSLTGDAINNTWEIQSVNAGIVDGVGSFSNIQNLVGNTLADDFVLQPGASIESIDGATGTDSLTIESGTTTWSVTSANTGSATNVAAFTDVEDLIGGSGEDTFVIADGASVATLDGAAGPNEIDLRALTSDIVADLESGVMAGLQTASIDVVRANATQSNTILGSNQDNTWVLSTANNGGVTGVDSVLFAGFENIVGNAQADDLVLSGGTLSGQFDGLGGANSVTANDQENTWLITSANAGSVDGLSSFVNVDTLNGNDQADTFILQGGTISGSISAGAGDDQIQADEFANTWTITGVNSGQVTGVANFDSVETVVGGSFADTFVFSDAARIDNVDGGADGIDVMNLDAYTTNVEYNLALGTVAGMSVANIDSVVIDNGLDNTLFGANQVNSWQITGANSGNLNGSNFSGFANLTGGTDVDTFELAGGSLSGVIDGNFGSDVLLGSSGADAFVITSANAGDLTGTGGFQSIENLGGNAGNDTFEIIGGSLTGAINGGTGTDTLTAADANNAWQIDVSNGGVVNGVARFDEIESLVGNSQVDTFAFVGGSLSGGIDGSGGNDEISADASISNTFVIIDLNEGTATNIGTTFTGIESINGGDQADNFTLAGGTLSGTIDGGLGTDTFFADNVATEFYIYSANSGSVTGLGAGTADPNDGFTSIENLEGNAQDDRFVFVDATLDGYINGQGGMDLLVAATGDNQFEITSDNSGTATGITGGFQNVESIEGNTGDDTFILNGGILLGTVDGRAGDNTLIADDVANIFVVNAANTGAATGLASGTVATDDGFVSIQNIVGNDQADTLTLGGGTLEGTFDGGDGMDTLVADNVENTFTVYANDSGSATGLGAGTVDPNDGFDNVENLVGNAQSDSFVLAGGVLMGTIDGAGGVDTFTANNTVNDFYVTALNYGTATGLGAGTVDSTDGFSNVETLIGNDQSDTFYLQGGTLDGEIIGGLGDDFLNADDVATTVVIDGANSGSMTGLTLGFSGIENILGNNQVDTFIVDGGSLTGFVFGGAEDDSLTVVSTTGQSITWTVDNENSGAVDSLGGGFQSIESLIGSDGNDTFTIDGTDLVQVDIAAGAGSDTVNVNTVTSGSLQGEAGDDEFNIAADVLLQNIEGGADNDTFNVLSDTASFDVVGGDGDDTLDVAHSSDNNWIINGVDNRVQSVAGGTARFASTENLSGGDGVDTFDITAAITGSIFGEGNADIFNLSESVTGVIDAGAGDDTFNILDVAISTQLVGGADEDTLQVFHDDANIWTINGVNNSLQDENAGLIGFSETEVLVGNVRIDTFDVTAAFVGRLNGNSNDDVFNLAASVSDGDELTTDILGGAGNDTFNITALNVNATIDGGTNNDTLVADHGFESTWIIDGVDDRVLDTAGGSQHFTSIEFGVGGDGSDTFQIGSAFNGRLDGRGGDDVFLIGADVDDGNTLTRDLVGGAGDDSFELATAGLIVSVDGGDDSDTLDVQFDDSILWTIDGANDRLNDSASGQTRFANIESSLGSSGVDTFNITSDVSGFINGRASDDIFNLSANVGTVVEGGADDDTFNINATGLTLNLDGGAGTDTIVTGHDTATTWTFDTLNDRVEDGSGGVTTFVSAEFAQGGNDVDTFNVTRLFAGRIDGQGSNDIFNFEASVTDGNALTDDVLGGQGDDQFNINVAGISLAIEGGEGTGDAVVATHTANNTWTFDGNSRVEDDLAGGATFSNVEIARGNDQIDQFIVSTDFNGQLDGQGGNDLFTLAANVSDGNVITSDVLGGAGDDVFSIELAGLQLSVDGGADADTLTVSHIDDSNWIIDGSNNRVEDASAGVVQFAGVETNQGGSGVDVFDILAQVDGFIDGRGGNDTFNISADVLSVVRGGAGDDNFVINSTGLTLSVVGELGEDTLTTAYNSASTWTLDGVNNQVAEVNGGVTDFSGVENLVGGDAVDTFDITNFFQGTINGAANADVFNFSAGVSDNVLNTTDVFGGSGDDVFNILAFGLTLDLDAQGGTDTLVGPESSNTWLIGSSNTLNGSIEFASVENFTGGTQVDNFIVEQGVLVNEIRGAADGATELGDDTLALAHGPSDVAVWRVTGENQGSIDGQVAAFYSVENLTGGEGSDDFVFTNVAADVSGLIDGGISSDFFAPAEDTLRLDVMIDGVVVELGPVTASENLHVDNVETIIAAADPLPNDATDTEALNQLVNNETADYRWIIDGRNEGQLEPIVLPEEENTVNFENFGTLVAGLGEDSFLFEGEGNITGGIIGGSGNNTADYSNAAGNITITIGNGTGGGISGFTTIIGNNDGSAFDLPEATLQIANGENQWFIENTASDLTDGVNDGQFSDGSFGATDFTFVNFNNLSGGSDQDTFIVNGDATITGTLSGGANALANPDILNATNATQGIDVQVGGDDFAYINIVDIENVYANLALASSNTIYASDTEMNNWEINGVDAGRLNSATDFEGFANLEGTTGADTFVFDADDRISGLVNGAGGINDAADLTGLSDGTDITVDLSTEVDADLDVLNIVGVESITANPNDANRVVGQDVNNVWLIDAANSGLVQRAVNSSSDTTVAFNNFAYLIGGSQNDEFIFDVNGTVSGAIFGGELAAIDAFDSVDVTDLATDVRVGLGESASADINIVDIELVFANENTNNTLIADQMDNTWTISGSDIGDVNETTDFENFANLEGRNANDTFVFTDQGRISGYIDAANENVGGADVVDMSALSIVDVTVGLGDTHVRNVEEIVGNDVDSTLTVDELIAGQGNNWLIDGEENDGLVNGNIRFTGFNAISGSANDDVFTLQNAGAITGLISAQAGNDTLNIELSGVMPEVSFAGGEGDDRVIVDGDLDSYTGNYTPRTSTAYLANAEQLEYSNEDASSIYTVSYTGVETLQDDVNASQLVINGSVEANVIRFAQEDQPGRNAFVVERLDAGGEVLETYADVNFSGKENLRVNADLIDTVEIAGDIDIANSVEIQGANVTVTNTDAIVTSDHLALVNVSGVASETDRLVTDVNTLAVSANSDVYVQEQNAIEVTEFDIANSAAFDIELVLAGDFTSTAAMQSNGDVRIQTNTGQISLTGDNQLGGELSLLATNSITLNNLSTTQLADVQAQTLNVISTGAIEDVDGASITVLDLAQLSSESDILLDGDSHSFNRVSVSQSNSLDVVDGDGFGLIVEGVTSNETASIASNGMTISGDINAQTISLEAAEGALQLNALLSTEGAGESFGEISMNSGAISQGADVVAQGDISIASTGQYQMADETQLTSVAGGVELTAEGAVNLQLVNADQDISIASTNDTVTANAAITSMSGSISLSAFGDLILSDSISSESDLSAISEMEDVIIDNILTVNEGELVVNAGQEIQMNEQSAIEVGSGTAELVAGSDISITSLNVGGNGSTDSEGDLTDGQVTLDSADGAIIDANGDAINVVTHRLVMDASNGIANGGVLETSIDRVSAGNDGHDTSSVGVLNDKTLIVERIHNNGDISVIVTDGDLLLDNTNYVAYERSVVDANGMGGVEFTDANLAGGIVDANYEVGSVVLRTNIGDIQVIEGNGSSTSRAQPVIAGRDVEVNTVLGQSGDFRTGRRLSIYANDRLVLRGKSASRPIFAFGVTPDIYRNLAEEQPDLASLLLESGDLLVEVESIEAVNPAVFSAVNNYSSDQTAILMPADQRYEDDDDEDELSY